MVATAITAAIIARGATTGTSKVHSKAREYLNTETTQTVFEEILAQKIEQRAEEFDSPALWNVVHHWSAITDDINTYKGVFESEEEAIDWIVEQIEDYASLNEAELLELRQIVASEYSNAVDEFQTSLTDDESIQNEFQTELGIEILEELRSIKQTCDRISDPESFELFKFPDERAEILDMVLPRGRIPFVDRDEIPDEPNLDRYMVLGPTGAGKTRIICEWVNRLPDDVVDYVLIPKQKFLSQEDARAIGRKSFDGNVLLIWEDVHRVNPNAEGNLVERTLLELEDALGQEQNLYTLLEARSGRLEDLPDVLPEGFENENSVWYDYKAQYVGNLEEAALGQIIHRFVDASDDVSLSSDAVEALVARTINSPNAPQYIQTVVQTSSGELTEQDIVDLPEEVTRIWSQGPYPKLREESLSEWRVLAGMKLLYDLRVPLFSKLVQGVYLEYLDGDRTLYHESVDRLKDRMWLQSLHTKGDFKEEIYYVHDTQLEPISIKARERPKDLSDLLLKEVETLPINAREQVYLYTGSSFFEFEDFSLAKDHWKAASEIGRNAVSYYNYGYILAEKFDEPEKASEYFKKAFEREPDYVEARSNYAVLLMEELDEPDLAGRHFREAIKTDPEYTPAQTHYARLLIDQNEISDAKWHLEKAMFFDPENPEAFYQYGKLLNEKFDQRKEAEKYWARAFELDESYVDRLLSHIRYIGIYGKADLTFESDRVRIAGMPEQATFKPSIPPTTGIEITVKQAMTVGDAPDNTQVIQLEDGTNTYDLTGFEDGECEVWAEIKFVNEAGVLRPTPKSFPSFIKITEIPDTLPIKRT
jgi:tetratricopeptide (TPR) repeat protein